MLRRVCVLDRSEDARIPIDASIAYGLAFDSLFAETAGVVNGFAAPVDVAAAAQDIEWHWVKGHSGHEQNEYVDQLANNAIDRLLAGR